jgi:eukaryotic-like serine/threonine-protein kinase
MTSRMKHFVLSEPIGAGGMGVVYRAHDERLDRQVAVKLVPADRFEDSGARNLLLHEARTASKLNHPNICTIHEVGESGGEAFIAMELVEGEPLSTVIAGGALSVRRVLRIGCQLADALAHAHDRGVIHRDLKSGNVMVTPDGRLKVLDFGLATSFSPKKLEDATTAIASPELDGKIVGTLPYMAPEQLRGRPPDPRSDIWALGVMLYEMTTGKRPFHGNTGPELTSAILTSDPPPLPLDLSDSVAGQLGTIIERCLEKEPGQRYQRASEVRAALEMLLAAPSAPVSSAPAQPRSRRALAFAAAAAAVLVLVALAATRLLRLPDEVPSAGITRASVVGAAEDAAIRSIAVLPVVNLSGDSSQDYFTDGMTDALITDISKIGALKVTSSMSTMRYRGSTKPLSEIARELHVDAILEASAMREGDAVRVSARLVDPATQQNLWAQTYDRDASTILATQAEVAREVAKTIRVRLSPKEETRLAGRAVNPETFELYLKGMHNLNKDTDEGIRQGVAYLREAVDRDPADPLAYAGLALGYLELAHGPGDWEDSLTRSKASAITALKLDDSVAEAWAALAAVHGYREWQWDEAFRNLDRAIDANPSLAIAYYHRSWFHCLFGRMDQAIEDHRRAQELDPFNPKHTAWLAELYRMEGRYEEAIAEAQKSIEIDPGFPIGYFVLGLVAEDLEKFDEAIAWMRKAAERNPSFEWAVAHAYIRAGRTAEARAKMAELEKLPIGPMRAWWRAVLYGMLRDYDEAFRWIAFEPHHPWLAWIHQWCPSLMNDPRWPGVARRFNLPTAQEGRGAGQRIGAMSSMLVWEYGPV